MNKMRMIRSYAAPLVATALFVTGMTGVHAATLNNTVSVGSVVWSNDLAKPTLVDANGTSSIRDNGDGTTTFMGSDNVKRPDGSGLSMWDYSWNITAKPDPFIEGTFSVTNNTASTQTFDITFGLPVTPVFNDGIMTGSLSGSYFDANNDGSATLAVNGWDGLIDSTPQMALSIFTGTCIGGPGCSVTLGSFTNGPLSYTGSVNTIGIHMNFDLSAGDTVDFTTRFEVTPVPVPAAVWLFGSGLVGLFGFARKKTSA